MSRIVAIQARGATAAAEQMLDAALAGRVASASVERHLTSERDGVVLGWVGSGAPNLAETEEVACVVDGAIFNAPALGLVAGETDAELVLRLYQEADFAALLGRLNGDFAIALHDRRSGSVWLARDRFGIRPLYWLADGDRFAAASRTRSLLALPELSREPNNVFLALVAGSHYRYFDNQPARSPLAAIAQLPQAHLLERRDGDERTEQWWELREQPDLDAPPEELAERYRELLLDAVRLRLERAGAAAFTLSGGMDSSSVIASAVHLTGEKQHAFSSVYSGSEYDESHEIHTMLDAAVSEWHPIPVDQPDVLGLVASMIDAHDEPVATATWLSHYVVCDHVSRGGFNSLFGGLGGDELNAGEYEYFFYLFADLRAAGNEDALRHEVAAWKQHHDHPIFRKNWDVMEAALKRVVDPSVSGGIAPDRARLERYNEALAPGFFDLREFQPVLDHPFTSWLKNRTFQDIFRETAPCCLRAEDRQTAVYGLRNVDPFFDHRLAELMFRVPGHLKIQDGVTKRLLRLATKGLLPEETRTRIKKTGWNAPADAWFAGPGRDLLHDLVGSSDFQSAHIYDVGVVRRLIDEHDEIVRSGALRENHMMFLWQLVNVELWMRWLREA